MRIGEGGLGKIAQSYTENVRSPDSARARRSQTTSGSAYNVTLSDLGRDMALARRAIGDVAEAREKLVSDIKEAVTSGAYHVPEDEIARKISQQLRQAATGAGA